MPRPRTGIRSARIAGARRPPSPGKVVTCRFAVWSSTTISGFSCGFDLAHQLAERFPHLTGRVIMISTRAEED